MKKLLIFYFLINFGSCHSQSPSPAKLDLEVLPEKKEYRVGEPIILQLIITNTADSTTLDLGYNQKENFIFYVGDKEFKTDQWHGGLTPGPEININKNSAQSKLILLDEWLKLEKEGLYELRVVLKNNPIKLEKKFQLKILPFNEKIVRSTLLGLIEKLYNNYNLADISFIALLKVTYPPARRIMEELAETGSPEIKNVLKRVKEYTPPLD